MKNFPIFCITSCMVFLFLTGCKASQEEAPVVAVTKQPATEQMAASPILERDSIKDLAIPTTMEDRFSYTYGYMLFSTMQQQGFETMDSEYFAKGVWDAGNGERYFTQEQMSQILHEVQTKMLEKAQAELESLSARNLSEAEEFLKVNKTRENVIATDSGLQYQILREGKGVSPTEDDIVDIDYRILLLDGTVLDSSYDRGYSSTFQLKEIKVPGFIEGVKNMNPGANFRFWIHPDLGYGKEGTQTIEPNSLLIVEVELKSVKKSTASSVAAGIAGVGDDPVSQ